MDTQSLTSQAQWEVAQEDRIIEKLRGASLRPTRQRVLLAGLLFGDRKRHVSADILSQEVADKGMHMATATIYNCLHQFESAGLIQRVPSGDDVIMFDTNISAHHHFLIEETGELIDIPAASLKADVPQAPEGYEVESVELVVKIRRTNS